MRLLTIVDHLFLLYETRKQPLHVGGVFLFEMPENADDNFVSNLLKEMLANETPPSFPFNQVLHRGFFWKTDANFNLDEHFRHIALPKPASMSELLTYISQEHGKLLNRANPMWECHIIEGIEGNRFALYFKIHHSMLDGVAALRLAQKSLSTSPTERVNLPIWSLMTRHRHIVDSVIPDDKSIFTSLKEWVVAVPPVVRELARNTYERFDKDYISITQAPASIINQPVSSGRRVSAQSYDLTRFQKIARTHKVSVNDVVLAMCSGALRRYLNDLNALPKKPLIGFIPYSLRRDKSSIGNQITFILANLATHITDPVERLKTIHASTNNSKKRFSRMSQDSSLMYSALAYSRTAIQVATGLFPEYRTLNVIISNVPGSKKPLYLNGAKLQALYPASAILNDQAMNITLCSYVDKIEFCLVTCSKTLPNSQVILEYIEEELQIFENLPVEK